MKSRGRQLIERMLGALLAHTSLQYWPVRVRRGYLRGCRWTLAPHSSYWRGYYEPEVQAALARHMPPAGGVAWDLGAHFGFYTLCLARAVGSTGQVCAFEPDAVSFARLRRHVAMNRFDHVRLYQRAASDCAGSRLLVQHHGAGATTSHLPYQGESTSGQPTSSVQSVALDELRAADRLRAPQFIKIDVEGHAAAALRGARKLIADHRPSMLVSFHSPDELDGVRSETLPLGYRPCALDGVRMDWPSWPTTAPNHTFMLVL